MLLIWRRDDATLSDALRDAGAGIALPCGGRGACGKCAVQARGALEGPSERERALLDAARLPQPEPGFRWRMACQCRMAGDCEVLPPPGAGAPSVAVFSGARVAGGSGGVGAAVDIGTTTISMALYGLSSGELLAQAHEMNRQSAFGADVLSRIERANQRGAQEQSDCVRDQLRRMLDGCLAASQTRDVQGMVVTGNTTMLHLLMGLDPRGIGVAPFVPLSLFGEEARLFGIPAYLPRCAGAYVGADVVCGMLSTRLCQGDRARMLVDVGTNGEMALFANGRISCCATAAGPAFEGATISMGMPATSGAIDRVWIHGAEIRCGVIGGASPVGICGTGMISALRAMLQLGVMDETGRLVCGDSFELGGTGIAVTQGDVRNLQLAKAAIAAGIEALLADAGIAARDLDALYLAGGFGSFIDPADAAAIGLIPRALAEKAIPAGNAALSGAARLLFDPAQREPAAGWARQARELPLATNPVFMDAYIDRMAFEEA